MKRTLFGTSALGLTLAVLASTSVAAQTVCDGPGSNNSIYVCDPSDNPVGTSGGSTLDLSTSTGSSVVNVQESSLNLTILDQPSAIAGSEDSTVEININAEANDSNNDIVAAGDLSFANIELGENDDVINVEGSQDVQDSTTGQTSLGNVGIINDSNIHMGAGNDVMNVAGKISNNGTTSGAKVIDMGEGDDVFNILAGGSAAFSDDFQAGEGDDQFYNNGSLSGIIDMGDGEDYFQNSQSFTGRIKMGDGNDVFHAINAVPNFANASTVTIDGGAHDMIQDPNDPTQMIASGGDTLRLDGTSTSSALNAERIANFETLIKQGTGTWSMGSSTGTANTVAFADGVQINEGTMKLDGMTLLANVENNATIAGDFKIDSLQDTAAGDAPNLHNTSTGVIEGSVEFSDFNDLFINDGYIRATHPGPSNNTAVDINMGGGSDTFRNSGNISGAVDLGDDDDRLILEGSNLFSISPAGSILGGMHSVGGGDTIELAGNGGNLMQINDVSSQIREFENIEVTSGTWGLSASQSGLNTVSVLGGTFNSGTQVSALELIVDGGQMNITSGFTAGDTQVTNGTLSIINSILNAPVNIGEGGHLHSNGVVNGNLTVGQGGEVSAVDHDQIGDFDVTGNVTLEEGSTVVVNVDPVTGLADMIDVAGFVTIAEGATIEVIPTSELVDNQFFEVDVIDAAVVEGVFNIANTGGYDDYSIKYGEDGTVTLLMGASFAPVSVTPGVNINANLDLNGNQILAHLVSANNLTAPGGNGPLTNELAELLDTMANGTNIQAQNASDAVSSEFYSASYLAARSYANHVGGKVMDRIDDKEWCATMQGAGEANCRANRGDNGDLWGSLEIYSTNNQKSRVSSHKGTTFAGLIGMDRRMGLMTAGVVGGFGVSNANVNTKGKTEGFNASVGGYLSIPANVLNIDSSLVYNYGSAESTRSFDNSVIDAGRSGGVAPYIGTSTFTGKSTTHQFSGNVRLTQEYKNEFGLEIQPSVGLGMNFMKMPGFAETATGLEDLALVMEDSSHFDADAKLGVQVRMPIRTTAGTMIPEARVNVSKKIAGQNMNTQAHFAGTANANVADFQIESELPDLTFNLGVGVNYELDSGLMLMGDYDFNGGSDVTEHKGSLGVRYDF